MSETHYEGISFFGLLTVVFITLKLCKVIDWNWWLVLAPIWIPIALVFIILAMVGLILLTFRISKPKSKSKKEKNILDEIKKLSKK